MIYNFISSKEKFILYNAENLRNRLKQAVLGLQVLCIKVKYIYHGESEREFDSLVKKAKKKVGERLCFARTMSS